MWFLIIYIAVMFGLPVLRSRLVDPECLQERHTQAQQHKDPWAAVLMLLHWGLAGLDLFVLHLSNISIEVQLAALVLFVGGSLLNTWSMIENQFFSSVVRIQTDRGQYVVDTGPYRVVRHPGNLGGILAYISSGLVLGSWLAMVPGLLGAIKMIYRLHLEDGLLLDELDGYRAYADRVRWRLVPGIW